MNRFRFPLVAVLSALSLFAVACGSSVPSAPSGDPVKTDKSAPTSADVVNAYSDSGAWISRYPTKRPGPFLFDSRGYDGSPVDTRKFLGKPVVMNFWYSTCPPCFREAPYLAEAAAANPGVEFVGINIADVNAQNVRAFADKYGWKFPIVDDVSRTVSRQFASYVPLQSTPSTLVLDPTGKLVVRFLGELDPKNLESAIREAQTA